MLKDKKFWIIKWSKNNTISQIKKKCPTRRFDICTFLYTCFTNIFIFIKNHPFIKGLNNFKHELLYTAYANDATFFLKDRKSIIESMNKFNTFLKTLRIKTK